MNKYSPKLEDLRASILNTESLLHFMRDRENLRNLLDHGCPDDPIGAMLDGAYNSISDANEFCQALMEARDEDFIAEYRETAKQSLIQQQVRESKTTPPAQTPSGHVQHIDTLDEIHEQTRSMLHMLMLNHRRAGQGEESMSDSVLENYAWQLASNMDRAVEASCALSESLK
jgi:hypothetical protein